MRAPFGQRTAVSSDRGPGPIRIAASAAARDLRLAVDVDRVRVLAALQTVGLMGGSWDDPAIAAGIRIAPWHRCAGFPALQRLHLRRIGAPLVFVVHRRADAIADQSTDRSTGNAGGKPLAGPA